MDVVVDTSTLMAVILAEPNRRKIIERTAGHDLIGPGSIRWEIGNAFSAMLKRNRLTLDQAKEGLEIFGRIPLRTVRVNLTRALELADETGMCAYDAYLLDCARTHKAPLLTLDQSLQRNAQAMGIPIMEV